MLDGRDIGTFVLPDANCKFFLTATPEERARRRFDELKAKGEEVDFDTLLQDIIKRDYNDSHRAVAPLKQAEDADFVDTTSMSIDDVVAHVKEVVHIKTKKTNQRIRTPKKSLARLFIVAICRKRLSKESKSITSLKKVL